MGLMLASPLVIAHTKVTCLLKCVRPETVSRRNRALGEWYPWDSNVGQELTIHQEGKGASVALPSTF